MQTATLQKDVTYEMFIEREKFLTLFVYYIS